MIRGTCINRRKGDAHKYVEYTIKYDTGIVENIDADRLKYLISTNQIAVRNLILTSNNQLRISNIKNVVSHRGNWNKYNSNGSVPYIRAEFGRDQALYINCEKHLSFKRVKSLDKLIHKAKAKGLQVKKIHNSNNSKCFMIAIYDSKNVYVCSEYEIYIGVESLAVFSNSDFKSIDLKGTRFARRTSGRAMFSNCKAKVIDLRGVDTSNIISAAEMFKGVKAEILGIESIDVSNIETMEYMFSDYAGNIIDISKWDMSRVLLANGMFNEAIIKKLVIGKHMKCSIKDTRWMFRGTRTIKIDLSNLNLNGVIECYEMFKDCRVDKVCIDNNKLVSALNYNNMFLNSKINRVRMIGTEIREEKKNIKEMFSGSNIKSIVTDNKNMLNYINNIEIIIV